jgi:Fe-S oxidoreductase
LTSGAKTVISACPYCLTMFSDGIKEKEVDDKLEAVDLAEYVEQAMIS